MGMLRKRPRRNTWSAVYRDSDGIKREVSTGCKSKKAAEQVLADLQRGAERVVSGIVSRQEARTAAWSGVPLSEHIEAHTAHMEGLHRAVSTVEHRRWFLRGVVNGLGWKRLADLSRPQLERWLNEQVRSGMGARNRNAHASAMISFANWLVRTGRLTVNPFCALPMLNEKTDRRRERRVMTLKEFGRLLEAAERRPLAETSKNRGSDAKLKPETIDRLLWLGCTRATVYKVLMFSGLRIGELHSITLGQVRLDAETPHIELRATDEKARRGALVPLPAHLVADLAEYIAKRKKRLVGDSSASVAVFPGAFDTVPLFDMPGKMTKVFDADLVLAGIATRDGQGKINKRDAYGRTLDIHALRHSFCTMVAQSGVNMQTAQRLMRHTTPAMTARYTHLTLSDLGGAIATLPGLPEIHTHESVAATAEATSTSCPPQRPPTTLISVQDGAFPRTVDTLKKRGMQTSKTGKKPSVSGGSRMVGDGRVELPTPCMSSKYSNQLS